VKCNSQGQRPWGKVRKIFKALKALNSSPARIIVAHVHDRIPLREVIRAITKGFAHQRVQFVLNPHSFIYVYTWQ